VHFALTLIKTIELFFISKRQIASFA